MNYTIDYGEQWLHVKFTGKIDGYDIIQQTGDKTFQAELLRIKRVIYDYSQAIDPIFNQETLKEFAFLAKLLAELTGHVEVIAVPSDPNNLEKLQAYQAVASSDKWRVSIARTPEEAVEMMRGICGIN